MTVVMTTADYALTMPVPTTLNLTVPYKPHTTASRTGVAYTDADIHMQISRYAHPTRWRQPQGNGFLLYSPPPIYSRKGHLGICVRRYCILPITIAKGMIHDWVGGALTTGIEK